MMPNREEIHKRIELALDGVLGDVYKELGITTGDISPGLACKWHAHVEGLAEIMQLLIKCNKRV
jgi:hypothetical protein